MTKPKKKLYIFASAFMALASVFVGAISFATEKWVVAEGVFDFQVDHHFEYGVFTGTFSRFYGTYTTVPVYMTCLWSENICAMLCTRPGGRSTKDLLFDLYNKKISKIQEECAYVDRTVQSNVFEPRDREQRNVKFMNSGIVASTIALGFISLICGVSAASLGLVTAGSEVEALSFQGKMIGLFVLNLIAFTATFLYILLWGVMFTMTLFYNVCVQDSLTEVDTKGRAFLGISYWINLIPLCLYLGSVCVLYARLFILDSKRKKENQGEEMQPFFI